MFNAVEIKLRFVYDNEYSRCQNSLTINVATFTMNLTYVNHLKKL